MAQPPFCCFHLVSNWLRWIFNSPLGLMLLFIAGDCWLGDSFRSCLGLVLCLAWLTGSQVLAWLLLWLRGCLQWPAILQTLFKAEPEIERIFKKSPKKNPSNGSWRSSSLHDNSRKSLINYRLTMTNIGVNQRQCPNLMDEQSQSNQVKGVTQLIQFIWVKFYMNFVEIELLFQVFTILG